MTEDEILKLINELISDRQKFNDFVYTDPHDAFAEVESRSTKLPKLESSFFNELPKEFANGRYGVLSRPLATPNYEARRFVHIIDASDCLIPLIFEYTESKFVPENECKYSLARLGLYHGKGKKYGSKMEYKTIIDIVTSAGMKISSIKTNWGENLVDFHHSIFNNLYKGMRYENELYWDGSKWFEKNGGKASIYYYNFMKLFTLNNILFDNFLLDYKEKSFTKEIFLPAFIKAKNDTGRKPLIVTLEHTTTEGEDFWNSYPGDLNDYLLTKNNLLQ